jgi:hypothetical protein
MVSVTEPLPDGPSVQAGDDYVVKVGRWMTVRCRVLESTSPGASTREPDEMVFDAQGTALGGIVRARFRSTVFRDTGGVVMARAQERIVSLPFLVAPKETLEREHRQTFRDLDASLLPEVVSSGD